MKSENATGPSVSEDALPPTWMNVEPSGLTMFVCCILGFMANAFVIMKLWTWFFVPLGAHGISYPTAGGLGVVILWCTYRARRRGNSWTLTGRMIIESFGMDAMTLAVGYLWHMAVPQ